MRKKREYIEGAAYHVTSRTNDRLYIFGRRLGWRIMLQVLEEARTKFGFKLYNFCVMPTHIHLLIMPGPKGNLSQIMHWVKTMSSKRWNYVHGSINHLWGQRFFARPLYTAEGFLAVMSYIDQNPVKAGLVSHPSDWKASGAYHRKHGLNRLVDDDTLTALFYHSPRLYLPT
jgi:putative transposase